MKKHTRRIGATVRSGGRPGMLPPLGVDFETALGALLKTPPPPKGEALDKPKARKRKTRSRT